MALGVAEVLAVAEHLSSLTARLDPGVVMVSDAMVMVEAFARIERMASTAKAITAKRATEVPRLLTHKGCRDPADFVARTTGTTTGEAAAILATAEVLEGLDATTEAAKRGEMAPRTTFAVAAAARANPEAEGEMLDLARKGGLKDVQERSREVRRAASSESEEQLAERARRRRSVRYGFDADTGDGWGRWRLPPVEQAEIVAELQRRKQPFFDAAQAEGRHESDEAYLADALVTMARGRAGTDPGSDGDSGDPSPRGRTRWNQKIIYRVDATAAERGHALPGERCEIAGVGPVPVTEIQALLASDAAKAVLTTDPGDHNDVQVVAHLGRGPIDPATLSQTFTAAIDEHGASMSDRWCIPGGNRPRRR